MSVTARKPLKDGGLDPLFDYSRTQPPPVILDDDADDVQIIQRMMVRSRRRPESRPLQAVQGNIDLPSQAVVKRKQDNDDDWLELPPSRPAHRMVVPADPTLIKLRRQKEELYKSLQMAKESAQLEAEAKLASSLLQPPETCDTERSISGQDRDIHNKREKILLQLQEGSGDRHSVKIYVDDNFEKLFSIFAEKFAKRPVTDYIFRFDGRTLDPSKTPKQLELEDEDIIEVFVKSPRC